MLKVIVFLILLIAVVGVLASIVINLLVLVVRQARHGSLENAIARLKKNVLVLMASLVICFGFVWFTQSSAYTPAIRDAKGNLADDSIAELRRVTLNGRAEWISIRGHSKQAPVLLFLAGGPGGTQMAAVRHDLGELERHFVVVNWDQPGAGKSYGVADIRSLAVQDYVDDGIALTRYLCDAFDQPKIYLMGESWGSALGIFLLDAQPELYRAFIGTGQMVAFEQTEGIDYQLAMDLAKAEGNEQLVRQLEANGLPPYDGADVAWKSNAYLNYLSSKMTQNPEVHNGGYHTIRDLFSEEYGILDTLNFIRGIINTFNHVYPQLYPIDLRRDYAELEVPVYFFLGRHDINAPLALAEEYMRILAAPEKKIVWFEHSAHSPWINESDEFVRQTLEITADH